MDGKWRTDARTVLTFGGLGGLMSYGECLARVAALQRMFGMPMSGVLSTAATSSVSQSVAAALGTADSSGFDAALQNAVGSASGATAPGGANAAGPAGASGAAGGVDGDDLAAWGKKYTGVPYVAGGRSPSAGWDCAGFTHWVYESFGVAIPEVSWEQVKQGTGVNGLSNARPGDLLFFHMPGGHDRDPGPMGINHVAMYLGNGKMVEAANPSRGTVISDVYSGYLKAIRRIVPTGDGVARTPTDLAQAARIQQPGPSGAAPAAGAGAVAQVDANGALSPKGLVGVLSNAGFAGESLRIAWALAMRESGGRPAAVGAVNGNGTRDHGLFQLNDIHLGKIIDRGDVYDAGANAAAAFRLSREGTNWGAWGLGDSGWAAHLRDTMPSTYAQLYARFKAWYDKYPGA